VRSAPPPSPFPPNSTPNSTPRRSADASSQRSGQRAPSATHLPPWAYQAATILSLVVGITAIVRGTSAIGSITDSDLTNFFLKSANYILQGDPWHMYAVRGSGLTSTYPNYNPPLSIFLMAPLLGLAKLLGFDANYGQVITFVSLPFVLLAPLLGYLVVRVLRFLYPDAPETLRFLAFLLVTLGPLTWQTYGTWYHVEQPLMLCFLVGAVLLLQRKREGLAGVLAGLAFLSRTTALIPLIALGVLLLTERQWRPLLKFAGVSGAIAVIGVAPFFIFDRADATYSFLTWRSGAPIGSNSIWTIFASSNPGGIRHLADSAARRLDMYSVIVVVAIIAFLAARRLGVSAYGREAWAVLAMATLAVPMLSKTNWPYYYLEPFIFILIWEFASMHDRRAGVWRWPLLSVTYVAVTATLSQYIGLRSVGALDRLSVGALEFVAMLSFVVAVWLRMQDRKAAPSGDGAVAGNSRPTAQVALGGMSMDVYGPPAGPAENAPDAAGRRWRTPQPPDANAAAPGALPPAANRPPIRQPNGRPLAPAAPPDNGAPLTYPPLYGPNEFPPVAPNPQSPQAPAGSAEPPAGRWPSAQAARASLAAQGGPNLPLPITPETAYADDRTPRRAGRRPRMPFDVAGEGYVGAEPWGATPAAQQQPPASAPIWPADASVGGAQDGPARDAPPRQAPRQNPQPANEPWPGQ